MPTMLVQGNVILKFNHIGESMNVAQNYVWQRERLWGNPLGT